MRHPVRHQRQFNWRQLSLYAALVAVVGGIFLWLFILVLAKDLPTLEQISNRQVNQSTKIYDREGKVLLYEINGGEKRTVVPFNDIPQHLKDATIAIEDENFYSQGGVSIRGILRALVADITSRGIVQGGSTITQQLAKNAFLSTEQTLTRKLKELILALRLEKRYTKDQILGSYLNEIPYGPTSYGVESASYTYFGKSVKDLTLGEAAILAALPKAPSRYSPWGPRKEELFTRQKLVLRKMRETGKISEQEMTQALAEKITFSPPSRGLLAPHFVLNVQDYLVQKYGESMVREGGLRVITTLDVKLQEVAERVVKNGAKRNEELYKGKNAALVAQDPKTGQILALVGSRDYFDVENEGNFNVATQGKRQPGSALKPFVYTTLFQKGYTADTVLFDVPTEFASRNPACPPVPNYRDENKECFHPEDYDGVFRGPVNIRQALSESLNIPAVKALYLAGLKDTIKTLNDFGVTTLDDPRRYGLSLTLGGGEVKLAELVNAYAVLAQDGVRHDQTSILEVQDHAGNVLEKFENEDERVIDAQYARMTNDILSDQKARANLFQGSFNLTVFPDYDVALKTGTTNDYRDAWSMGYTPFLAVGVWAGNNDNVPMQRRGGSILAAVPMWSEFMKEALTHFPPEAFIRPNAMLPEKAVLRGDYLANKEVHTILYYLNKNDPLGAAPSNPNEDPQFVNWETGVINWASAHIGDYTSYNRPGGTPSSSPNSPPQIYIQEPSMGGFISDSVPLRAQITGARPITNVRVFFNGQVVQEYTNVGTAYTLQVTFTPQNIQPQNLIEVEVKDEKNASQKTGVIVYSQS